MNTNSFRREVLIGVGGFVAGVTLWLPMANWPAPSLGLVVQSRGVGRNHIAIINLPQSSPTTPSRFAASVGTLVQPLELRVTAPAEPTSSVASPPAISVPGHHPYHLLDLRPLTIQPKD